MSQEANGPLRMYIALHCLRAWNNGTAGYSAVVVSVMHNWIDMGMEGPIPWPKSPFFAQWAKYRGFSNINGTIGFRFTATLAPHLKEECPAPSSDPTA